MADKRTNPSSKGSKGASAPRRGRKRRGWLRTTLLSLLALVLALTLAGGIALMAFYDRTTLPDPNKDFQTNTSFLYYRDGTTKLGSFAIQNRQTIPYAQMPDSIKDAVVAAENRTFWTDRGISPKGIARSTWTIVRGGEVQGGSTITQQYIKILYLTSDRTMTRKLKELSLAVKMGKEMPKEQILEGYLNTIYFGRGAYGVQAASRSYFNTDASKLTVPQAAVLASVLNNPSIYDPSAGKGNTARLLTRYRYVLDGMLAEGQITAAEHAKYRKALPTFPEIPLNQRWAGTRGYLLRMVQNELLAKGFTQAQIEGGGLNITTTFDPKLQDRAVTVGQYYKKTVGANAGSKGAAQLHPAIASVQVGSGEVLAIYGGDDYIKNSRNWATTDRPAASTFKTWAAVAGLREGMSLSTSLNGNTFRPRGDSVDIRNEFKRQYGRVTLGYALQESINTAFVDLTEQLPNGPAAVVKAANDAGIGKGAGWDENNRIALGMAEVSPLENAGGYATLANGGKQVPNHVVREVKDLKGKVLYSADVKGKQAIEPEVAADATSALATVVNAGTGRKAAIGAYPVAGKTGTNGIDRDGKNIITSAWFVAYTKQISTAVMYVAGDDGNQSLDDYARPGDSAFFGGTYPALAWQAYMKVAMEGLEVQQFDKPANIGHSQRSQQPAESQVPSSAPSTSSAAPSEAPSTTPEPSTTASAEPSASEAPSQSTQPSDPATDQTTQTTQPTADSSQAEPGTATTTQQASQPTKKPAGGRTSTVTQPTQPATSEAAKTKPTAKASAATS